MKRRVNRKESARKMRQAVAYERVAAKAERAGNWRQGQHWRRVADRFRAQAARAREREERHERHV